MLVASAFPTQHTVAVTPHSLRCACWRWVNPVIHVLMQTALPAAVPALCRYVWESVSHEIGHTLGLSHDLDATGSYSQGVGNWAPIMGSAFYKQVTQFGPTPQSPEDDFGVRTHSLSSYRRSQLCIRAFAAFLHLCLVVSSMPECAVGLPQACAAVGAPVQQHMRAVSISGSMQCFWAPVQLCFCIAPLQYGGRCVHTRVCAGLGAGFT